MSTVRPAKKELRIDDAEIDQVLYEGAARGDFEALAALYDRRAELTRTALLCAGANSDQADAAVQAAFLRLWREARGGLGAPRSVPARVVFMARDRLHRSQPVAPAGMPPSSLPGLGGGSWRMRVLAADPEASQNALIQLLAALDEPLRWILALGNIAGFNYDRVGEALSLPPSAAAKLKAEGTFLAHARLAGEAGGTPGETVELKAEDARRLVAYADGALDTRESAALEKALDAAGPLATAYEEIVRLRRWMRDSRPQGWSRSLYETIEQTIRTEDRRRRNRRGRIALECAALAAAIAFAAAALYVSNPSRLDRLETWAHARGWREAAPSAPADRPGSVMGWLTVPQGTAQLELVSGGRYDVGGGGARVRNGERVIVAPNGMAHLVLIDGTQLLLDGDSTFVPDVGKDGLALKLEKGSIWCALALQRTPAEIHTPLGIVEMEGYEGLVSLAPMERQGRAGAMARAKLPTAPEGAADVARVSVVSGRVKSGTDEALIGETLIIASRKDSTIVDTPFGDTSMQWPEAQMEAAPWLALRRFNQTRYRLAPLATTGSVAYLQTAAAEAGWLPVLPGKPGAALEQWLPQDTSKLIQGALEGLRVESFAQFGSRVSLDVSYPNQPGRRQRIVYEVVKNDEGTAESSE